MESAKKCSMGCTLVFTQMMFIRRMKYGNEMSIAAEAVKKCIEDQKLDGRTFHAVMNF